MTCQEVSESGPVVTQREAKGWEPESPGPQRAGRGGQVVSSWLREGGAAEDRGQEQGTSGDLSQAKSKCTPSNSPPRWS